MENLFIYILKSTLYLSIFYIGYKALLAKETFFSFNRIILLLGISLSLIIPAIEVERNIPFFYDKYFLSIDEQPIEAIALNEQSILNQELTHDLIPINQQAATELTNANTAQEKTSFSWLTVIAVIYISGCALNLLSLGLSYQKMKRIVKKAQPKHFAGIDYFLSEEDIAPFSWRNTIVISKNDTDNLSEILAHEKAHIANKHYNDILLSEVILAIHWFNPLAWMLKLELKDIHEYQADSQAISAGLDAEEYQLLILKKAVGSRSYTLANSFNHSKIKKRITMMLKSKSKSLNQLKAVFLILFSGIFIYACSNANSNSKEKSTNEQEIATLNTESAPEQQQSEGTFANPVDMSKVTSRGLEIFNAAGSAGSNGKTLRGDFIAAIFNIPDNTPVYAVLSGKVEILKKDKDEVNGFGVLIKHDDGLVTLYENCQSTLSDNTEVKQGEQIGVFKKNTDQKNAKQSQLLFAIMKDKHSFNPNKIFDFDTQKLKVALKDIDISNKGLEPWPLKTTIRFVPPVIKKDGKDASGNKKTIRFTPPVIKKDGEQTPPPPIKEKVDDGKDASGNKKTIRFTPPVIKKDGEQAPPPPVKATKKDEAIESKDKEAFTMSNISATSENSPQEPQKKEVLEVSIKDVPKKENNTLKVEIKDVPEKKDDTLRIEIKDVN